MDSAHKQPSSELARSDGKVTRSLTLKKSTANELIGPIDSKLLAKVGGGKGVCDVQKNQTIFSQGDAAESVFYIQRGRVKLTVVSNNGKEAVMVVVFRQPGANIIDTVDRIKAELPRLKAAMPSDVDVAVASDRSITIRASLHDTELTLVIAVVLVIVVVFLFLSSPMTVSLSVVLPWAKAM